MNYFEARRRLVEGQSESNSGAWPITWCRISKGWGLLPEAYWPGIEDPTANPLPNEPTNADEIAKNDRLVSYRRFYTEQECLISVERHRTTIASIEISSDWHSPTLGRIPLHPLHHLKFVHSIGIVDFDFETSEFLFPNTWGEAWGDRGFGYLPWGYLTTFMNEGWSSPTISPPAIPQHPGVNVHRNGIDLPGIGKEWIIELLDGDSNVMMGWGIAVQRKELLRVEELFVRPEYRRRGFGKLLANEFIQLNNRLETVISFWIPWGDHEDHNSTGLLAWARSLGLCVEQSGVRWAAYKATFGSPIDSLPMLAWIPRKATSQLALLAEGETKSVRPPEAVAVWDPIRAARRHELIQLKYESSLTADESMELEELQRAFGMYQDSIAPLP